MKETADTEKHTPGAVKPLKALRGVVTSLRSGGITAERRQAQQAVAERVAEEVG